MASLICFADRAGMANETGVYSESFVSLFLYLFLLFNFLLLNFFGPLHLPTPTKFTHDPQHLASLGAIRFIMGNISIFDHYSPVQAYFIGV